MKMTPRRAQLHSLARAAVSVLLVLASGGHVWGITQATIGASQIAAASDAAVRGLKDQVDQLPLGANLRVKDFLDRVNGHEVMLESLRKAELIGGPRAIGVRMIQVRLDLPGRAVAETLSQLASDPARKSPLTPAQLARLSQAWADRVLTATGSSASPVGVSATSPTAPTLNAFAVNSARRSAAADLLRSLVDVANPDGGKLGELLVAPGVSDALLQQVSKIEPREVVATTAGEVSVTLILDKPGFTAAFRSAVEHSGKGAPTDEAGWQRLLSAVSASLPEVVTGTSRFSVTDGTALPGVTLDRPPTWFFAEMDAEGTSPFVSDRLLTARRAESAARDKLREYLLELEVGPNVTLRQALAQDPRLATAVDRALTRGRITRVEFLPDGGAVVRVGTDPRALWQDVVAVAQGNSSPAK
jgi:hypothetical protein